MTRDKLYNMAGTYLRAFVAALITAYVASDKTPFTVASDDIKAYIAAGTAAVLPVILVALNKNDTRYGLGAAK